MSYKRQIREMDKTYIRDLKKRNQIMHTHFVEEAERKPDSAQRIIPARKEKEDYSRKTNWSDI